MESGPSFSDFLFSFWWLLFPLAFFLSAGWDSWMKYRRHQATLDMLKSFAASGKEPPEGLLKALEITSKSSGLDLGIENAMEEKDEWQSASPFVVILMLGLAGVFAYATHSGLIGLGEEGYFVALILGVIGLSFLVSSLFKPRK